MSCPQEPEVTADWTLWVELWARAMRDPETSRKREALDRRWRATIADIVREGQRAGEFLSVDADGFALRLTAVIDGMAVQVLLADPEVTAHRMLDTCLEMASSDLGFDAREGASVSVAVRRRSVEERATGMQVRTRK